MAGAEELVTWDSCELVTVRGMLRAAPEPLASRASDCCDCFGDGSRGVSATSLWDDAASPSMVDAGRSGAGAGIEDGAGARARAGEEADEDVEANWDSEAAAAMAMAAEGEAGAAGGPAGTDVSTPAAGARARGAGCDMSRGASRARRDQRKPPLGALRYAGASAGGIQSQSLRVSQRSEGAEARWRVSTRQNWDEAGSQAAEQRKQKEDSQRLKQELDSTAQRGIEGRAKGSGACVEAEVRSCLDCSLNQWFVCVGCLTRGPVATDAGGTGKDGIPQSAPKVPQRNLDG